MSAVEAIRAAMEAVPKGWGNLDKSWTTQLDDDGNSELNIVGAIVDDEAYPVIEIDTALYYAPDDGHKLAEYYAACNTAAMAELLAHVDSQQAEIDRLKADAARYQWLRKTTNYATSNGEKVDVRNFPELWDASIDSMIAETPKEQP